MKHANPEGQRHLTAMLDRWTGLLGALGVQPHTSETPKSLVLATETGETISLNAPSRNQHYPDAYRRQDLGYTNEITAHQALDGVSHTLHVNSETSPYVLAAEDSRLVEPRTSAQAMIDLCLRGELTDPPATNPLKLEQP